MNQDLQLAQPDEDGADLAALFATAMADLDTRPDVMAGDAVRLGRPRRRRRIAASVAGGVAAMTLFGGVGAYGLSVLPSRSTGLVAPAATATPTHSPTPTSPGPMSRPVPRRSAQPLTARVAALHLTRLAPSGTLSDYEGQEWYGTANLVSARAQIDRGEGKVGIDVGLQSNFLGAGGERTKAELAEIADFYRCDRGADVGESYDSCEVTRKGDGSILMTYVDPPESARSSSSSEASVVHADFLRPDGTRVSVSSGNVPDLKYGGEPRRGVSLAEVRRIATDPVWDFGRPTLADVAEAERVITPWRQLPN